MASRSHVRDLESDSIQKTIMTQPNQHMTENASETSFVGLAPFLRLSIAGIDFVPLTQEMLAQAAEYPTDANLWMNLATAMLCLQQHELGLAIQNQALTLQRTYRFDATEQPAKLRLLVLAVPGDLSANIPLDCLLEESDIDLIFHYISSGNLLEVPDHDALIVGISACDETLALLESLEQSLADWSKPVINAPEYVPNSERNAASLLLQNAPGLLMCPALRTSRAVLENIANGSTGLRQNFEGCEYPVILRPVGSHGGRGLDKIESAHDISAYLAKSDASEFFLSQFVDYSGPDGLFRKARIALIDGVPFACHMAVSSHWMVHYVNADMYEDARKREEEAAFMADFDAFVQRHRTALATLHARTNLDYVCIDCAETREGQLMVFEIDPAMVVHAMDTVEMFPYKQVHMAKVKNAFRDLLFRRTTDQPLATQIKLS